MIFAV
jgi:hypothetical protein